MLRKIMTVSILSLSTISFAEHLEDFNSISTALTRGHKIRSVINTSFCDWKGSDKIELVENFSPSTFNIVENQYLTFSKQFLTLSHPSHTGVIVLSSIRYYLNAKGTLKVINTPFDPTTYGRLGGEVKITCQLNEGVDFYSDK